MMRIAMSGGNVRWRGYQTPGYFGKGKARHHYQIDGVGMDRVPVEIRQGDEGGWDIVFEGVVVGSERLKSEAQREAESLLEPEIRAAEYRTGFRR